MRRGCLQPGGGGRHGRFLRSNGIRAHVSADSAAGNDPVLNMSRGVRVLVAPGDESEALKLLAEQTR